MEADRWLNLGAGTYLGHPANLMRGLPWLAICPVQQPFSAPSSGGQLREQRRAFVSQYNVPRLAGFALPDGERAAIRIEVVHAQSDQFAITAAGGERSLYQWTEFRIGGIDEPFAFGHCEIASARCVHVSKGPHLAPCGIGRNLAVTKGVIQCSTKHGPGPGSRRPTLPFCVVAIGNDPIPRGLAVAGAQPGCAPRHAVAPAAQPVGGEPDNLSGAECRQDMNRCAGTGIANRVRRPAIAFEIFEIVVQRIGDCIGPLGLALRRAVGLGALLRLPERQNDVAVRLAKVVSNDQGTVRSPDVLRRVSAIAGVPAHDPGAWPASVLTISKVEARLDQSIIRLVRHLETRACTAGFQI